MSHALDRLWDKINARRAAPAGESYTAQLLGDGVTRIVEKLEEECGETIAEALAGDRPRLVAESADLLYHLCVLWAACGASPAEVWHELDTRSGGLTEKANRSKDD